MTGPDLTSGLDFDIQDNPSAEFIAALRAQFPTEREVDKILTRKLEHRAGPPYQRPSLAEMAGYLDAFLTHELGGADFRTSELRWFTGGVSKIQIGFTLDWQPAGHERRSDRMVLRMDPSEGSNATSRAANSSCSAW